MASRMKSLRKPIVIEFAEPVSDDLYLGLAAAIMTVVDLAGTPGSLHASMTIDPDLDDEYDLVDPFGQARSRRGRSVKRES
ncbi:hypothetical protein H5V45_05525 [Nocardioides sp. KIGAM211]|uniref:Uncharacterized protein n=1 Tax=Nocardioides luti TaxID=2761101 RepID=A0A7X0REF3_9ACTN|nr:hypothetical protein [Nocardioides luti]MBB6626776.1 hypothetical protein [Nocardioides luti]